MNRSRYYVLLFSLIFSLALTGCNKQPVDTAWNEYLKLFQEGKHMSGLVKNVAAAGGVTEVEVEYTDASGQVNNFKETWPTDLAAQIKTGDLIDFYSLESNLEIKQATTSLLKYKKAA